MVGQGGLAADHESGNTQVSYSFQLYILFTGTGSIHTNGNLNFSVNISFQGYFPLSLLLGN